jgi:vancomycin aglycone glucosyltransferase
MKFALASYGSRGDVEPCIAVGRELLRRGHDVRLAVTVPPDMLAFIESAGLTAVPYGPDWQAQLRDEDFVRMMQNPLSAIHKAVEYVAQISAEKTATLMSLTNGADLLVAGMNEQGLAANVAEYYGIRLAALHSFPPQILERFSPHGNVAKQAEHAQRRALGLPEATGPSTRSMVEDESLEIQAYDELCFPGLAAEWADQGGRRPFVGALTLELPTDADDEILSRIAEGPPPIYFGFGSTPIAYPADTVAAISAACTQLGERALIWSGPNDFTHIPHAEHVMAVDTVGQAAIFPLCRAVVHHGGAGTTAAGLRAGIPTLILWNGLDQPVWADSVTRLKVGLGRCFSESTVDSLVADLHSVLAPHYASRAREVATQMTTPAESLARAADLLEDTVRRGHVSDRHRWVSPPVRFRR